MDNSIDVPLRDPSKRFESLHLRGNKQLAANHCPEQRLDTEAIPSGNYLS